MSAAEIIQQIDALPPDQLVEIIQHIHRLEDAGIPESFKQSMAEIQRGESIDLDTILSRPPPPDL